MIIKIYGVAAEGKSAVAALIAQALQGHGLAVELKDGVPEKYDAANALKDHMWRARCLRAIATRHDTLGRVITVETVHVNPPPKSEEEQQRPA